MMIALYDTTNSKNGYNDSRGGKYNSNPTEKTRQKLSEAGKGKKNSMYGRTGYNNPSSKPMICITTGYCFGSSREAARYYGISYGNINRCCRGEKKSAGKLPDGTKLVWRRISDIPKPQLTESDKEHLRYILNKYSA